MQRGREIGEFRGFLCSVFSDWIFNYALSGQVSEDAAAATLLSWQGSRRYVIDSAQEHFKSCGQINRITILVDKFTGSPKGFAYIEFADEQSVQNSLLLNGSLFRGRQLKVKRAHCEALPQLLQKCQLQLQRNS